MAIDKDQLDIATKLNSMMEAMARSSTRLEQSYETQVTQMQKLADIINSISTKGALDQVAALNAARLDDVTKQMSQTGKASETMSDRLKKAATTMEKKVPVSAALATAAISGLYQGVRNIFALGKAAGGFFKTLTGGLLDLTVSILAVPIKIFSGLVNLAQNASGTNELAEALENLRKEFGALTGPTPKTIIDMSQSLKGFSDTGLSAWRVFGTLAERIQAFTKLGTAMGATFLKVRKEFEDNGGALLAYQKGLGISDEQMASFAQRAIAGGDKISDTLKETSKYALELGKAFGVDSKVISKDMAKAMADVKHFAGASIKEIGQASAYARKLGVELDKIVGTLDAFETFDTAAENTAKLSQAFGVQVDAFKLMEAQNPAEQVDMLRKSFIAAGKSADTMSRQELKLLSQTTGLDEATARLTFSSKNQALSLDEIKKKGGEAEKKTLTQAEAMSKLADNIERLVKSGAVGHGGFFDHFVQGILAGLQSTKEFRTTMMEIRLALQQVYMIGVQLGKVLPDLVPGLKDFLGGMSSFFSPKHFTGLFKGISDSVKKYLDPKSSDAGSIPKMMENLKKHIGEFFSAEGPNGMRMVEGFKNIVRFMGKVLTDGITWLSKQTAVALSALIDLLTGKTSLQTAGVKGGVAGGLGFLAEVLGPIAHALGDGWKLLEPEVMTLLHMLGHKIVGFLKSSEFRAIIMPALPFIGAALFGPSLGRMLLTSLSGTLLKQVFSGGGIKMVVRAASSLLGQGGMGSAAATATGVGAAVAAAAAIGMGVKKYTNLITTDVDHSTKVISAGMTGLIDAVTLGLLPDDLGIQIADALSKFVDMFFVSIKHVLGEGFGESLKRYIGAQLEVFGNIFEVVKNLFTGDQADFDKSVDELGYSLLRMAVTAFEYLGIQLPLLLMRIGAKVTAAISGLLIKLVTTSLGFITGGIDKVFGTDLTSKLQGASDSIRKSIAENATKQAAEYEKAGAVISKATAKFQDESMRSSDDKAKIAAAAAKKGAQPGVDSAKGTAEKANAAMTTVSENIRTVKNVQKELQDKNFDLPGAVMEIKNKLTGVSFDFLSQEQVNKLDDAAKNISKFSELLTGVQTSMSTLAEFPKVMAKATAAIKGDAIKPALEAVSKMIASVKALDDALGDGNLNKINVAAKLQNVATSVGLGAKSNYSIQNKGVNITVNMQVTMDVGLVEKAMILRATSVIRDRLNFATQDSKGVSPLPDTQDGAVQYPVANTPRTS